MYHSQTPERRWDSSGARPTIVVVAGLAQARGFRPDERLNRFDTGETYCLPATYSSTASDLTSRYVPTGPLGVPSRRWRRFHANKTNRGHR